MTALAHSSALTAAEGCPSGLAPVSKSDPTTNYSAFVRTVSGTHKLSLNVTGAKCGGCLSKIETATTKLPGVQSARLNLSNGRLEVAWTGDLEADEVAQTVANLGYGVSAFSASGAEVEKQKEERGLLIAMGVAGFAAANIMLLSVSVWAGHNEMGETTRRTLHALSGVIAFPAIAFAGRPFFKSAFQALKHRNVNMDVPISLAVTLAFCVSVYETITGGEHAYFDACVMLLFFLLIGRFLDARLRRRAYAAAHDLAAMQNKTVHRLDDSGASHVVRSDEVSTGDRLLLAPGERAVVDMRIIDGHSNVDESLVTGESLPRDVSIGMTLYAGTVNLSQSLIGHAIAPTQESLLSDISDMVELGEQKRSHYRRIADKAVSLYVPFVHTVAACAFLGWLLLGASVREAILVAVATLIITCPCALALAAPVVQVVASGRLFKNDVFLKSGDALERLADVDYVVFDKTGTLTLGTPRLKGEYAPIVLRQAAQLARASRHPLSRAIVDEVGAGPIASQVSEEIGQGLEAEIDGVACRLGSAEWIGLKNVDEVSGPSLWFKYGSSVPVQFAFEDQAREGARKGIEMLKEAGLGVEILSGDRPAAVAEMAERLGIEQWSAQASPVDKAKRLDILKAQGHKVLMVGDGLNDAGALALAHAALAPGGALDISQSASDAVYSGSLSAIDGILRVSKRAKRAMLQNFGLAAAYNMIAVPIAVTGHVTPLIAAIAMSASSLIVTLNALRIGANNKEF
ncbi:MAG: heavy metal translocating P-type ATPase [Hyphomonas sp.]